MSVDGLASARQKLPIILDELHDELVTLYNKLFEIMSERCNITVLKKKPLYLNLLSENDVFMIISSMKKWKEEEIEVVRQYVESDGGTLVAMADNVSILYLNQLFSTFGLTFTKNEVKDKHFDRENLGDSTLLAGVDSLASGKGWFTDIFGIAASARVEVVLKYKDVILGVKRSLGKGTAYFFSCSPVFGNKQLDQAGNRRFLENLLTSLGAPTISELREAFIKGEFLAAQQLKIKMEDIKGYSVILRDPLPEVSGGAKPQKTWDRYGNGNIRWLGDSLSIEGRTVSTLWEETWQVGIPAHVIVKVVIAPLPQSSKAGIVHIFTKEADGIQGIYCLDFPKPKLEPEASRPPLWLFQAWLTQYLPADKLETRG